MGSASCIVGQITLCSNWLRSRAYIMYSYVFLIDAGVKFIVVAENKQKVEELLKNIYELYADFVLKNPFYSLDMPIR